MSKATPRTRKIIETPAPLEYTEVTEPVAQALRFEATEEFNRLLLFTVSTVSSVRDPFKLNF